MLPVKSLGLSWKPNYFAVVTCAKFVRNGLAWCPCPLKAKMGRSCRYSYVNRKQGQVTMSIRKKKLSASVRKIIPALVSGEAETVEIRLDDGEDLYREIRIANIFTDQNGEAGSLRPGSHVDVIVEADIEAVTKETDDHPSISVLTSTKAA